MNIFHRRIEKEHDRCQQIAAIRQQLSRLNAIKYYDTACALGEPYHELPFRDFKMKARRNDLRHRVDVVEKHCPGRGLKGIDLGCAIGGVTFELAKRGSQMTGVDINKEEIQIAQSVERLYRRGCIFVAEDVHDTIQRESMLANYDFAIWFSQWMWYVKQYGLEEGKRALYQVSCRIQHLFFETSIGDANAGPVMQEHGIIDSVAVLRLLNECTHYGTIVQCKVPKKRNVRQRPIFYCCGRKNYMGFTGHVERVGYDKILKDFALQPRLLAPELDALGRLQDDHFPQIISVEGTKLVMNYCGEYLTRENMPSDCGKQCEDILDALAAADVLHRDINPTNLLVRDGVIHLVDFAYSGRRSKEKDKSLPNQENKLPRELGYKTFRHPDHFDDAYSLSKAITYIRNHEKWHLCWKPEDHK